jgi:hypothetical protein
MSHAQVLNLCCINYIPNTKEIKETKVILIYIMCDVSSNEKHGGYNNVVLIVLYVVVIL